MSIADQPSKAPDSQVETDKAKGVEDPAKGLRHEAYQVDKSDSAVKNATEFRDIIKHLKEADRLMDQLGGPNDGTAKASVFKHYEAAQKLAGMIDQDAVSQREKELKQLFKDGKDGQPLAENEKKAVAKELAMLDNMHRAPSFTSANEGMALIRLGYDAEGKLLISKAQALDPDLSAAPQARDAWEAKFAKEHQDHFAADVQDAINDNSVWHKAHGAAEPTALPLEITQAAPVKPEAAKAAPDAAPVATGKVTSDQIDSAEAAARAKAHDQAVAMENAADAKIADYFNNLRKQQGLPVAGDAQTPDAKPPVAAPRSDAADPAPQVDSKQPVSFEDGLSPAAKQVVDQLLTQSA